jgi:hypothetical protein
VQIVPATAGEAVGATKEQELVARLDAEAGRAHGPIVVAGELHSAVVNVFFLPPFGRHAVPTKWGFFFILSTNWRLFFSYPETNNFEKNKKYREVFFRPDIIKYLIQMAKNLY